MDTGAGVHMCVCVPGPHNVKLEFCLSL